MTLISIKKFILILLIISLGSLSASSDSVSSFCQSNVANFDYELPQLVQTNKFVPGWGPALNTLQLSPEFLPCLDNASGDWQRQRLLAAADYWIKQKLNYCHHHLPYYAAPLRMQDAKPHKGGYCSAAKNMMQGSIYYHQQARWNYKGTELETAANWVNNRMWYGMDCSNYTSFLYHFALGGMLSSNIKFQAGQRADKPQNNLSPNQQSGSNILDNPHAAGKLVCRDNTLEVDHSCAGHGGYLSVIDHLGNKHPGSILSSNLAALHPGDLLFISTTRPGSAVVHVVMWTGKHVNLGPNDIHPEQIAPNVSCPQKDWMPHLDDWIITDSHYQGPDYRIITSCYYLDNLWGGRRIIAINNVLQ